LVVLNKVNKHKNLHKHFCFYSLKLLGCFCHGTLNLFLQNLPVFLHTKGHFLMWLQKFSWTVKKMMFDVKSIFFFIWNVPFQIKLHIQIKLHMHLQHVSLLDETLHLVNVCAWNKEYCDLLTSKGVYFSSKLNL